MMSIPGIVKSTVKSIVPEATVILFGSRARGDYHEQSDWDFLILLNHKAFNKQVEEILRNRLYELELEHDVVINSLIHSEREWQQKAVMPIHQIIESEGIIT